MGEQDSIPVICSMGQTSIDIFTYNKIPSLAR